MSNPKAVAIVGGGPAGLYLSILLRNKQPGRTVTVFERNMAQVAYGFGVVFSDETLDNFQEADGASYRAMSQSFRLPSFRTSGARAWDQSSSHRF